MWAVAGLHVREGRVRDIWPVRPGLWQLRVDVDGREEPALLYEALTPVPAVGDRVALNTTAVDLGLGTGGMHFVIHVLGREGPGTGSAGHIVKLRYTPLQFAVLAAEEPASPHHDLLVQRDDLAGMPVVVAELHSQLPPAAAALRLALGDDARIAYVMTDGGALPLALSSVVDHLRQAGLLDATVTVGHAFGGDLEAVNVFSGLLAARWALAADAAIVAMGPGVVGTGTRFGTTAIETGHHLDAADVLGGRAVAALRLSFADPRPRQRGVSHHTLTALGVVAQRPCWVALPRLAPEQEQLVWEQLAGAGVPARHRLVVEDRGKSALDLLARRGVELRSMGRTPEEDAAPFLAAAAAGFVAADLLLASRTP
ncbi:MAG: hypothetical protein BAA04_09655 [Firmicutes bacterium ZCTH02-B6]|nr:MAG: hypothetical protein BAA04_09655 [Firmicutes bacterium ZCTH02-B6]